MTWNHHRIWILGVLLISGVVLAWFFATTPAKAPAPDGDSVSTTTDLTGRAIYTNGEYGFTVSYPETAQLEESFSSESSAGTEWRINPVSTGTPIIAIIGYSTMSDHSYPRNFTAQVRVGASADAREVAACLEPTPSRNETSLPDTEINGTTWKKFSFGDAGAMQYVRGVSYRTVHEAHCIALEQIQSGSSYRDDPRSSEDIPDETLQARYNNTHSIIESFRFVRP